MDDKKRKRLVTNEIKRLTDIFKEVDSKKQRTIKGLIEESAFMKATNDIRQLLRNFLACCLKMLLEMTMVYLNSAPF